MGNEAKEAYFKYWGQRGLRYIASQIGPRMPGTCRLLEPQARRTAGSAESYPGKLKLL